MQSLQVNLAERSYPIYIGERILDELPGLIARFLPGISRLAVITDQNVDCYHGRMVLDCLGTAGISAVKVVFPAGEDHKDLNTVEQLSQSLIELGLDRHSAILALGGGIVGDVAGFVAASFMRGIKYLQMPTTLLAQVDSSVGGKTGVNLPGGKNLVGAFHQPQLVFCDIELLRTLPDREFKNGLAEVIKYGIIKNDELFAYLEANQADIRERNSTCLLPIIYACCAAKAQVVANDEKESGERALLNLGHTYGHAFENLSHYKYSHGEAVAAGIAYAARLAENKGLLTMPERRRIIALIEALGLPSQVSGIPDAEIVNAMHKDKKSRQGTLSLVLPIKIGEAMVINTISDEDILLSLSPSNRK